MSTVLHICTPNSILPLLKAPLETKSPPLFFLSTDVRSVIAFYCNRKPQHLGVCNLGSLWCHSIRYASAFELKGQTSRTFPCEKEIGHSSVPDVSRSITATQLNNWEARHYISQHWEVHSQSTQGQSRHWWGVSSQRYNKQQQIVRQSSHSDTASIQQIVWEPIHGDTASIQREIPVFTSDRACGVAVNQQASVQQRSEGGTA